MNDCYRRRITRWRLPNHKLKIETGRYSRRYIEREYRFCLLSMSSTGERGTRSFHMFYIQHDPFKIS